MERKELEKKIQQLNRPGEKYELVYHDNEPTLSGTKYDKIQLLYGAYTEKKEYPKDLITLTYFSDELCHIEGKIQLWRLKEFEKLFEAKKDNEVNLLDEC